MTNTDRRSFLSGGLRAAVATAGGILLPMRGQALAFAEPAALPDVPIVTGAFTASTELLQLRHIIERQRLARELRIDAEGLGYGHRGREWVRCQEEYERVAGTVIERSPQSWADIAEVAEIAWRAHPKAWLGRMPGESFGMMCLDGMLPRVSPTGFSGPYCRELLPRATSAMIEGILTLTGGQRNDPAFPANEPVITRRISEDELDALYVRGARPGGAHG